jgi:hypothetical protein
MGLKLDEAKQGRSGRRSVQGRDIEAFVGEVEAKSRCE